MDIEGRLIALYTTLGEFKPQDGPTWQLAQIYNALLDEVKKAHPGDPVVEVLEPVEQTQFGQAATDCGTLRAATMQLRQLVLGN